MSSVLVAASYSIGGFSLYLVSSAGRDMVPGGSTFHLEPGTIHSLKFFAQLNIYLCFSTRGAHLCICFNLKIASLCHKIQPKVNFLPLICLS